MTPEGARCESTTNEISKKSCRNGPGLGRRDLDDRHVRANKSGEGDAGLKKVGTTIDGGTVFTRHRNFPRPSRPGVTAPPRSTYAVVLYGEIEMERKRATKCTSRRGGDVLVRRHAAQTGSTGKAPAPRLDAGRTPNPPSRRQGLAQSDEPLHARPARCCHPAEAPLPSSHAPARWRASAAAGNRAGEQVRFVSASEAMRSP